MNSLQSQDCLEQLQLWARVGTFQPVPLAISHVLQNPAKLA